MFHFLPEFENQLQIIRKLKYGTTLFRDFHKDSLMHSIDNTNNENVLSACKKKEQNSEPTRNTATSSIWFHHLKTNSHVEHKKIKATKSDQYAVLGKIPGFKKAPQMNEPKTIIVWHLEESKAIAHGKLCFLQARSWQNLILIVRTLLRRLQKQYWNASTILLCWQLPESTKFKWLDYEGNQKRHSKKRQVFSLVGASAKRNQKWSVQKTKEVSYIVS